MFIASSWRSCSGLDKEQRGFEGVCHQSRWWIVGELVKPLFRNDWRVISLHVHQGARGTPLSYTALSFCLGARALAGRKAVEKKYLG